MANAVSFNPSLSSLSGFPNPNLQFLSSSSSARLYFRRTKSAPTPTLHHHSKLSVLRAPSTPSDAVLAGSGGGGDPNNNNNGGNNGGDDGGEADNAGGKNWEEAMIVLAEVGRVLQSLQKDLKSASEAGRVPGAVVEKSLELEKSSVLRWLMQVGGYQERLLADDLFLDKICMECGVAKVLLIATASMLAVSTANKNWGSNNNWPYKGGRGSYHPKSEQPPNKIIVGGSEGWHVNFSNTNWAVLLIATASMLAVSTANKNWGSNNNWPYKGGRGSYHPKSKQPPNKIIGGGLEGWHVNLSATLIGLSKMAPFT